MFSNNKKIIKTIDCIKNNKLTIGSWIQIADTSIAKIMSHCGFDWLVIDLEHGNYNKKELPSIFDTISSYDILPLARMSSHSVSDIKEIIDAGAGGIIAPMVQTVEQAENIVKSVKYPPVGARGIGFSSANGFGAEFSDYFAQWNKHSVVIVQIEHIEGVNNLEQILQIKDVDGFIVGPYDLSGSMDLTGQFEHPDFQEAIAKITRLGRESGKLLGMHVVQPDPEKCAKKIAEGFNFIAYSIDSFGLIQLFTRDLAEIKSKIN